MSYKYFIMEFYVGQVFKNWNFDWNQISSSTIADRLQFFVCENNFLKENACS